MENGLDVLSCSETRLCESNQPSHTSQHKKAQIGKMRLNFPVSDNCIMLLGDLVCGKKPRARLLQYYFASMITLKLTAAAALVNKLCDRREDECAKGECGVVWNSMVCPKCIFFDYLPNKLG